MAKEETNIQVRKKWRQQSNYSLTMFVGGDIHIGVVNHPGTRKCPGGPEELPGVRVNSG